MFFFFCWLFVCFICFAQTNMYTRICMHACTYSHMYTYRSCVCSWPVRRAYARGRFVVCALVAGSSCVRSWPVRRVRARGRFVVCALVVRSFCACGRCLHPVCAVVAIFVCVCGYVRARGRFVVCALVASSSCVPRGWFVVCALVAGSSCARSWPVRCVRARGQVFLCMWSLFAPRVCSCGHLRVCMWLCARSWPVRRVRARGQFVVCASWLVRRVCARGRFVVCALVAGSLCARSWSGLCVCGRCLHPVRAVVAIFVCVCGYVHGRCWAVGCSR